MSRKAKVITLDVPQKQFLYDYLRGTGNTITISEARDTYGIQQLPARMSELRGLGLKVNTLDINGETGYSISARDIFNSRAKIDV